MSSNRITGIYLLTHRYDMRLTRICVASIRYWYPDLPIFLIKDRIAGDFSTVEIETVWNVGVFPTEVRKFGWGFAHLEPIFQPGRRRILVLDVDIVFVGPVLTLLEQYAEDYVVQREDHPQNPAGRFGDLYFRPEKLRAWDPTFVFPGYAFNAGQFVATTGVLSREDFDDLIAWEEPRHTLRPEIFNRSDQGAFNFAVMRAQAAGRLSLARVPFMVWNPTEMAQFDLERITPDSPYRQLIHWAGSRRQRMADMPRADILGKFEDFYYSKVRAGGFHRTTRGWTDRAENLPRRALSKLTGRQAALHLE